MNLTPLIEPTGITTGGGTYVGENVSAGRDFVGHDSTAIYAATVYIGNLPPDETDILADEPSPGDPPFKGLEYFDVNDAISSLAAKN